MYTYQEDDKEIKVGQIWQQRPSMFGTIPRCYKNKMAVTGIGKYKLREEAIHICCADVNNENYFIHCLSSQFIKWFDFKGELLECDFMVCAVAPVYHINNNPCIYVYGEGEEIPRLQRIVLC